MNKGDQLSLYANPENTIRWLVNTSGGLAFVNSGVVSTKAWHHLAAVYDRDGGANNVRLYLDLVMATPATASGDINSTAGSSFNIGCDVNATGGFFDGKVALLRLYNRALSTLEIQNSFDREKNLFGVW